VPALWRVPVAASHPGRPDALPPMRRARAHAIRVTVRSTSGVDRRSYDVVARVAARAARRTIAAIARAPDPTAPRRVS
jgi:hypothetical protein